MPLSQQNFFDGIKALMELSKTQPEPSKVILALFKECHQTFSEMTEALDAMQMSDQNATEVSAALAAQNEALMSLQRMLSSAEHERDRLKKLLTRIRDATDVDPDVDREPSSVVSAVHLMALSGVGAKPSKTPISGAGPVGGIDGASEAENAP